MKPTRPLSLLLNLFLLLIFLAAITWLTIEFAPGITKIVQNPVKLRNLLLEYGSISTIVFIVFQILQVIIAVIPGELIQLAGGYIYGTFWGTFYSIIGILAGSMIAFGAARLIGFPLVKAFVKPELLQKYDFLINSKKSEITIFLLFLIPGIPKDILVYIAGLSPVNPFRFFIIFTLARFPALIGSSYIGANIQQKDYLSAAIVIGISLVLFIIGVVNQEKLMQVLSKILHFTSKPKND